MITIENDYLRVTVSEQGGCIKEIFSKKLNRLITFSGNPEYWNYTDHILFPFCGRCIDGEYTDKGKTYATDIHGFAKDSCFTVLRANDRSVEMSFSSDAATLAVYPFEFRFIVKYELCQNNLAVTYSIANEGCDEMYFSVGSHPAFLTDAGAKIVFPREYDGEIYELCGNYLSHDKQEVRFKELELNKTLFQKYGTIILKRTFDDYTIKNQDYDIKITSSSPVIALWTDERRDSFVCAESWWGVCDYADSPEKELKNKLFINALAPGKTAKFCYTVGIDANQGDIK